MRNITGPPVKGTNFLFRENELNFILNGLRNGNSFLLLGIRRTGKSSVLRESARLIKDDKAINIVELDCQDFERPSEFLTQLYDKFPKSISLKIGNLWQEAQAVPSKIIKAFGLKKAEAYGASVEFDNDVVTYWTPLTKSIREIIEKEENPLVIFLDELPFFFENMLNAGYEAKDIRRFLTTLREWRNAGLQMVICGSINIDNQINEQQISLKLLSGMLRVDVKPFTREEGRRLINKLLENKNLEWWNDEFTNLVLDKCCDYIPYFVQHFFARLSILDKCDAERLDELYELEIYPGLYKEFLYQFEERLARYHGDQVEMANRLLDAMAKADALSLDEVNNQMSEGQIEQAIMLSLMNDEILRPVVGGKAAFALDFVKNWWIQKRGL